MTTDAETIADLRQSLAGRDAEIRWLKAELLAADRARRAYLEAGRGLDEAAAQVNRAYDTVVREVRGKLMPDGGPLIVQFTGQKADG